MSRIQSLADYLGVDLDDVPLHSEQELVDIAGDAEAFCQAVLNSREFRQYIVHGLSLGSIPAAVVLRVMDMAGWRKPPERIEHTGKDGQPIETVSEVRRVVVRSTVFDSDDQKPAKHVTH